MAGFMDLISWIDGKPWAVGLHRKRGLYGWEGLSSPERSALNYEREWHDNFNLKGNQYGMNFQYGGGVVSLPAAQKINNYFNKFWNMDNQFFY